MPLRTFLATIALAVFPAALQAAQNPPSAADSNNTTIVHVTVVDVATGKESPDQTVVLQGDHIVSVAAFDVTAAAPPGRVVDAHGAYLIPGLWDMHVHIQDLEDLPLYIANGVIGVRLMFGVRKPNHLRARLAKEPAAPEVLFGSIIVDGDPPVWPGSIVIHNANDARRAADEIKASGADFVKIYNGIPRDAYFALAEESRKQNIPFAGHLPFEIRASEASDAGQRTIEHLTGIAIACSRREQDLIKQLRPMRYIENTNLMADAIRSFDAARCQDLFAQFRRNITWQVPTLTVHRAMGYMNDSHFTSDPRAAYMSGEVRRRWDPSNDFRFRQWPSSEFELHRGLFKADEQMVGLMFRVGVPLLAGTDAMNPYCMPGFSLHDELALLVESGLTPLAALQAATLRPAEFLGRTAELGSVARGKRADLVLLSADPLADIHNTTQIQSVWLRGKYFDRAALDQLLAAAKRRHGKSKLD
ncbi:MAG TPA: amidohydrolase family protein [Candidatus Acidoferrales bacterium]|nr:amidohydrolase family protein [Candidatus Acidoferrales bacterium]